MTQRLTTQQLRSLLRPETALLGLMLVGLVAWYVLNQQAGNAQEEEAVVRQQVTAAGDDLIHWETNFSAPALQQEIEQLQSMLQEQDIPTHQEALAFRTVIFAYSAERQLLSAPSSASRAQPLGRGKPPPFITPS